MSQTIDLSGPLYNGTWSYNMLGTLGVQLPEFSVERLSTVAQNGFESFSFGMSSLSGSYIETASHMMEGAPMLSDLPVESFIRPAVVCHVPRKGPEELIHGAELAVACPPIQAGDALLIDCGWGNQWRSSGYVTCCPAFHFDCLPWLLTQQFSILGVDTPCIENARSRPTGNEQVGAMLTPIFRRGILLLAPLINLDRITTSRGEIIALPLNISGASGAPCRAVFRE